MLQPFGPNMVEKNPLFGGANPPATVEIFPPSMWM